MSGRHGGFRGGDEEAQRKANAEAPRVADLGQRVVELFRPYRGRIAVTGLIVIVSAAIAVVPPLIVQRVFDDALFPPDGGPDLGLLVRLVAAMIAL
ncbi:MAG TPA: ABC transporter ATP-binding protein, partial [Arachnia sp.]|nr:ABC transporter ATP-binding protein [Arachnia sp.]